MTESLNDINPTVDKQSSVATGVDEQVLVSDINGDDDFFICRKCNKVFKSLPEYLEHKIKDENYRISQMRSRVDRRMVLPQLVQKQRRQGKKKKKMQETLEKNEVCEKEEWVQSDPVKELSFADSNETSQVNSNEVKAVSDVKELVQQQDSANCHQEAMKKRAGRRKLSSLTHEAQNQPMTKDDKYICVICKKKFRREATLRWHVKYDHENKKEDEAASDSSENELTREAIAERDEDFKIELGAEDTEDHHLEGETVKIPQEIHIIIEQPNAGKQHETKEQQITKKAGESQKYITEKTVKGSSGSKGTTTDRPFTCDICGRGFKELTVLKAHGVVHSDERKFICTMENCPYGFKTKGGLVRHMRRHTGERPYACEKCGRAFSESGALTRHMKARRNCAQTPDSAYPRYMKNWTYHPNIPAVIDPTQRDAQQGRSTMRRSFELGEIAKVEDEAGEIHYLITDAGEADVVTAEIITSEVSGVQGTDAGLISSQIIVPQLVKGSSASPDIKIDQDDTVNAEEWNANSSEIQDPAEVVTVSSTHMVGTSVKPLTTVSSSPRDSVNQQQSEGGSESQNQESDGMALTDDVDLIELKNNADVEFLKQTQCHVCKKDLEAVEGLEIHLHSHLANQPSRCGLCHFSSQDREELRQHILSMHYDSLNNIEASVLAMEEEPGGIKGETMQDRKTALRDALVAVKQLYSLKKTKTITEVEKPSPSTTGSLQCMVCNRFFRGSSYLRQHMRTHTGDRPHQCQICHRSFTSRDILKKHMYVHKDQRDFKCGECGKLFKRMAHVQQHLRIHTQERSFRCGICDKLFKTQNSLKVHLRTHSGINPYKCLVCNRHFRERGSLQRHMRLHTGEKPYKCPMCNRAFAEQGTLSRHLKAKMPCSVNHSTTNQDSSQASDSTVLAQFSTMVADTQQYILPEVEGGQQYILPAVQDQEMSEDYVVLQTVSDGAEEVVENIEVITEGAISDTPKADPGLGSEQTQDTETLQIFDSSTGESLIIVADKSIVDLVREQQLSLESGEGGSSLQKIKDILLAAKRGDMTATATALTESDLFTFQEADTTALVLSEEMQMQEGVNEETVCDSASQSQSEGIENVKEEVQDSEAGTEITPGE